MVTKTKKEVRLCQKWHHRMPINNPLSFDLVTRRNLFHRPFAVQVKRAHVVFCSKLYICKHTYILSPVFPCYGDKI